MYVSFFFKLKLSQNLFQDTTRVTNSLEPDQGWQFCQTLSGSKLLPKFTCRWQKSSLGQIKKILVFRVTLPYLNLLVTPRILFLISCILKGEMPLPFKMHEIIFFPEKNMKKSVPTLKFSDPVTWKTQLTLIFLFGLSWISHKEWLWAYAINITILWAAQGSR